NLIVPRRVAAKDRRPYFVWWTVRTTRVGVLHRVPRGGPWGRRSTEFGEGTAAAFCGATSSSRRARPTSARSGLPRRSIRPSLSPEWSRWIGGSHASSRRAAEPLHEATVHPPARSRRRRRGGRFDRGRRIGGDRAAGC